MSGAVQALLVVLAIVVVGVLGYKLKSGSRTAAQDSARCLDPRQPGCYGKLGKEHPAAGLLSGGGFKNSTGAGSQTSKTSAGQTSQTSQSSKTSAGPGRTPQDFAVPRTEMSLSLHPALPGATATAGSGTAEALRIALGDILHDLPEGVLRREAGGTDPDTTLVEYVSRSGDVLYRVLSGHGSVTATDYDRGLVYELNRDGTLRRDGALADPGESAEVRAGRLVRHWGLPSAQAAQLGHSQAGSAAFIDLRRGGVDRDTALSLAQQAATALPGFATWRAQHKDQLSGLPAGKAESVYEFLSDVPVLSRLLSGILGEPTEKVAQRFGYDGSAARRFLEGATEADLLLARRLPPQTLPARIHGDMPEGKRTLHGLVGDTMVSAALPLCLTSLQRAVDQPEEVVRLLSALPPGYPYVLLSERVDGRRRPLLIDAATILSWAAPLRPQDQDPSGLARLSTLPADAPVALQVPLSPEGAAILGVTQATGEAHLRAFAPAGELRKLLLQERSAIFRLQGLWADPRERAPIRYFAVPPFVYASVLSSGGPGGEVVLLRRGIPGAALLRLDVPVESGREFATALPAPTGVTPELQAALLALAVARDRVASTLGPRRGQLSGSTAGRDLAEKWTAVEGQVAMAGLLASCAQAGHCPLPGVKTAEDGVAHLALLRQGIVELRPRAVLGHLPVAEAAQLSERLGELLAAANRVVQTLSPERSFHPATRDVATLARIQAYVQAATGEPLRPDPAHPGAFLVHDLDAPGYRDHLAWWERGEKLPRGTELDGEGLRLRQARGDVPGTLGELVQRHGEALQAARPVYLAAGEAQARVDRRVRVRFASGLSKVSLVQTMDPGSGLRDAEVLVELPSGALDGYSYDGDGRLRVAQGTATGTATGAAPLPVGGSGCLSCHQDKEGRPLLSPSSPKGPTAWHEGTGGVTWLTPVVAAELAQTAAARRAAELFP